MLCVALLAGCSGSDGGSADPQPTARPGSPLSTVAADGLPADFPRDEVPLIKGDVASVEKGGPKDPGYAVAILTDASRPAAVAKAVALLVGAGWDAKPAGRGNPPPVRVLTRGDRQVIITNSVAGGQTLISYAIDLPS
ncbi:hypothetical protein GCM10009606_26100 [Nocardioides aquiterrae]|uniref:Uncharacterized protein n=1 Tax=Nocardioides aquiterrae TaxID=203799 RepID=A0ABP4F186_9ACTN